LRAAASSSTISRLGYLARCGIGRAEVGFLRPAGSGTTAVDGCPSAFLHRLAEAHPAIGLVAMLNPAEPNWRAVIDDRLQALALVRLTCTAEVLGQALEIAEAIRGASAATRVSINLICISSYSHDEVVDLVRRVDHCAAADYLYFADSRGALAPREVGPLIDLARRHCRQSLGFHAHDTRGNAVENSRVAFAHGCALVDVSLNGFGLAGGNTPFAGLLADAGLADDGIDARTRAFCADHLSLRHAPGDDRALYRALADRNVDPIWSEALTERYGSRLKDLLRALPRRTYKTQGEVETALDAIAAAPVDAYRRCA
jgi:4-hydroxy 2-oxovalerate aldolase